MSRVIAQDLSPSFWVLTQYALVPIIPPQDKQMHGTPSTISGASVVRALEFESLSTVSNGLLGCAWIARFFVVDPSAHIQ
jgi:hypothetical protein